jgi:hypothetical protein|tara:strand:- start:1370 stop:1546 length:177 start_codon:yes stop_codon:yes gene_type:complete
MVVDCYIYKEIFMIKNSDDIPSMDYVEHNKTYIRFVKLTKFSSIFLVVLLALMAIFLV